MSPKWFIKIYRALLTLKLFFRVPLNLSRRDALFDYQYDNILDHNFSTKKVGNWLILKKFVTIVLITHFFILVHLL